MTKIPYKHTCIVHKDLRGAMNVFIDGFILGTALALAILVVVF
jgi:hypothetical protein